MRVYVDNFDVHLILILSLYIHTIACSKLLRAFLSLKSCGMKWVGHIARTGEMTMHTVFWMENLKGRYHLEDKGVHGRIILKRILGKEGGKV